MRLRFPSCPNETYLWCINHRGVVPNGIVSISVSGCWTLCPSRSGISSQQPPSLQAHSPFCAQFLWSSLSVHLTPALPMTPSGTWGWPHSGQLPQLSFVDGPAGICFSHPSSLPCLSPPVTTESSSQEFPHSMSIENLSPRTT